MPFSRVGEEQKIRLGIINKLPIFFIPGILGSGDELRFLAWRLYIQSYEEREIFIFDDERSLDDSAPNELTLDEQVNSIAAEIKSMMPKSTNFTRANTPSPFPFFIIGYSYGCTLATLVAQQLEEQGEKPYIYLIDGISPACFQRYTQDENNIVSFTQDLILMVKSAANLAGIEYDDAFNAEDLIKDKNLFVSNSIDASNVEKFKNKISFTLNSLDEIKKSVVLFNANKIITQRFTNVIDIDQINQLSVEKIMQKFKDVTDPSHHLFEENIFLEELNNLISNLERFNKLISIIKSNLENLFNYTFKKNVKPLKSITTLITHSTTDKYNLQNKDWKYGGWSDYTFKISKVKQSSKQQSSRNNLLDQTHLKLLQDPAYKQLARSINRFLEDSVPYEKILEIIREQDLQRTSSSSNEDIVDSDEEIGYSTQENLQSSQPINIPRTEQSEEESSYSSSYSTEYSLKNLSFFQQENPANIVINNVKNNYNCTRSS